MAVLKRGTLVRMVKCVEEEPQPPCNPNELGNLCNLGYSARPVQQHVGNTGTIQFVNSKGGVSVLFHDKDERILFRDEIEILSK